MGNPALCQKTTAVYHPRKPIDSPLYHLLLSHFDRFEQVYDERFAKDYGFYRPVISEVVRAYLKCGDLKQGFARVRCPDCHYEYLLAFSCRGRWFCPSCHAKKVVQFGEVLRENILYPVPHRQYVFSIPIIIRKFFLYNRSLLARLATCAADSLLTFFRTSLGLDDGVCGAVMTIQVSEERDSGLSATTQNGIRTSIPLLPMVFFAGAACSTSCRKLISHLWQNYFGPMCCQC